MSILSQQTKLAAAVLVLALGTGPALAQSEAPPIAAQRPVRVAALPAQTVNGFTRTDGAATATTQEPIEEMVVTGRRGGARPSFQEELEFHQAEFERLQAKYVVYRAPPDRGDTYLRSPVSTGAHVVRNKPTLTDRDWP